MAAINSLARRVQQLKTGDWLGSSIDSSKSFYSPERWIEPNLEIHPSSHTLSCPRAIQLHMLGHRTETLIQNMRRMNNGTDAHTRWTRDLETMGLLSSAGVRLKVEGEFSGEYDLVCKNPSSQNLHLGEIKTMNANRFRMVPPQLPDYRAMARELMKKEPAYVYQVTQYLVMFQKQLGVADEVFFLFENTDNQDYRIIWFTPDEQMRADAFKNAKAAQDASRAGVLIPPPFKKASATCAKCYRASVCYALQDGDGDAHKYIDLALDKTRAGFSSNTAEHEARDPLKANVGLTVAEQQQEDEDDLIDWD